jgi:TolB-like protein
VSRSGAPPTEATAATRVLARAHAEPSNARSIAVLPFSNLSADPENEYFSDGITEDILTNLSKIGDLHVISRTSIMRYKDTEKSLPEIAQELGVVHILEGSVRRSRRRSSSIRTTRPRSIISGS